MFSPEKCRQFCGGYGGGGGTFLHGGYGDSSIGSDLAYVSMADEELTLRTDNNNQESSSRDMGAAAAATDEDDHATRDQEWLQLSIGGGSQEPKNNGGPGLVELELMPSTSRTLTLQPEFRPPRPVASFGGFTPFFSSQHEINWAFRPIPISIASPSSSSSSYFPRPFQLYGGLEVAPPPTPPLDLRVIQPPRRPHSGIWFTLQASQNQ